MGDPRYIFGMDFIDLYKNEVGASEPQQDFMTAMICMQCKAPCVAEYVETNTDLL